MLADLAHVFKVKIENSLKSEFVLEVVNDACRIADSELLMESATYQILINVVFQPYSCDVIYIIQGLLDY